MSIVMIVVKASSFLMQMEMFLVTYIIKYFKKTRRVQICVSNRHNLFLTSLVQTPKLLSKWRSNLKISALDVMERL